ncbi:MAG TPA: hypothetical protein VNX68_03030 [Nitrosopumilaceae archaeon]|jgi:hypothetical protein|nr:hypothetical protein [Nitrosopumilaceae archaeon]
MTYKEKFEKETDWQRKIILVDLFHCRKLLEFGSNWRMMDTANYFQISLATVSEDITIAEHLREGKWKFSSRNNALKAIKTLRDLKSNHG